MEKRKMANYIFTFQVLMSHAQVQLNALLVNSKPNNAIINNNVSTKKIEKRIRQM
jgi:hypothetical protein